MRFSAKCSERNSLRDSSHCLNTAIKYSLFLPLASELLKNSISFNVLQQSIKTCHYYFLNSSVKHWPISIIFGTRHWEETWCKGL